MLMVSGMGFPTEAATWVPIQGHVRLADGTPICAMVLANGQYMFSCGGDGAYTLNVPLDPQGQVTLFAFADGFAPFRVTAVPAQLPGLVRPWTAVPGSPLIAMTRGMECAANTWVHISGDIESFGGAPLCAMVLANGQHMFSCDASQGRYDLTVPADENGNITVFGFADGFQPYSETFTAPECVSHAFDGSYKGTATSTTPFDQFGESCGTGYFQFSVYGDHLTGSATDTWGDQYSIDGVIDAAGLMEFGTAVGQETVASFSGTIVGWNASGTWSDDWGCRGTWSASKL